MFTQHTTDCTLNTQHQTLHWTQHTKRHSMAPLCLFCRFQLSFSFWSEASTITIGVAIMPLYIILSTCKLYNKIPESTTLKHCQILIYWREHDWQFVGALYKTDAYLREQNYVVDNFLITTYFKFLESFRKIQELNWMKCYRLLNCPVLQCIAM